MFHVSVGIEGAGCLVTPARLKSSSASFSPCLHITELDELLGSAAPLYHVKPAEFFLVNAPRRRRRFHFLAQRVSTPRELTSGNVKNRKKNTHTEKIRYTGKLDVSLR